MTEITDFDVASGRTASTTSVDRLEQSIESVLGKEREANKKIAIHRYVREASHRMCLHLPIKPRDTMPSNAAKFRGKTEENTLKLPELVGRPGSIMSMPGKVENAERHTADAQPTTSRDHRVTRLPSIEQPSAKRKRKPIENNQKKKTSSTSNLRNTSEENMAYQEAGRLRVVLCGRSPLSKNASESNQRRELYVSKHGRFKSR